MKEICLLQLSLVLAMTGQIIITEQPEDRDFEI